MSRPYGEYGVTSIDVKGVTRIALADSPSACCSRSSARPVVRGAAAQAGRVSPHESVANVIDGADVSITYGRPSMRGRAIMGQLVPYGRVWCPGADEATTLTVVAGRCGSAPSRCAAGSYTLWMLPAAGDWSLIVSKRDEHLPHAILVRGTISGPSR